MRVLIFAKMGGASGYISDGWINALRQRGHTVARWDGQPASWSHFRPDLYIGCSGHKQPIPGTRAACKLAIHVNPYGPVPIKNIDETAENIAWTLRQRPDVVFGYGHETDRMLWSYWTQREGVPWVPLPTAGDTTLYDGQYGGEETKQVDVVYLGGRWVYKGQSLDKYLLPLLQDHRVTYRLYGWGEWPAGVSTGHLPDGAVPHFLGSGRVAPCISEPHTLDYGFDLPERVFKAALCGTLVVHDPVPDLKKYIPSVLLAQNPVNFVDLCVHYSRPAHTGDRLELQQRQRSEVLKGHTYHHRMAELLRALSFHEEAEGMVA